MKIVLINASARKNGTTAKILNEFANKLSSKNNIEVKLINISDMKLEFCLGCCQCYKTGACFIKEDAEMLSELLGSFCVRLWYKAVCLEKRRFVQRCFRSLGKKKHYSESTPKQAHVSGSFSI